MSEIPWLSIIGVGEDGPAGLSPASAEALHAAEIVIAPPRHLALFPDLKAETHVWPVPFSDGLPVIESFRGRRTAALVSGDPFCFGAGRVLAERFTPDEWRAFPGPSAFSLAAARLGWGLERVTCLGLHAAPLGEIRPHLAPGARIMVLVRDGAAVRDLLGRLTDLGFGESRVSIMQAIGGPRERFWTCRAHDAPIDAAHPVLVAVEAEGEAALPLVPGRKDETFDNDGQVTRSPIRAMTLAALAPRAGELLWDIGGGSGSVAIEWALAHPANRAVSIEPKTDRAVRITHNTRSLGASGVDVVKGSAPDALEGLEAPNAVFIGGGLSHGLLTYLWANLPTGTRLVANAVTLESEALLTDWQRNRGGDLVRIEMSRLRPLGSKRGWKADYPITQWSVAL